MGRNVEGKIKGQLCKWVKDLLQTREIKVSRCLYEVSESVTVLFSIHGFGDASKRASCAMAYLVNCMDDGQAHASLVVSKTSRPLKTTLHSMLGIDVSENIGTTYEHSV